MREFDQDLKERQAFFAPFTDGKLRRAMQLAKAERAGEALGWRSGFVVNGVTRCTVVDDAEKILVTDVVHGEAGPLRDEVAMRRLVTAQFFLRVLEERGLL